jgi:nitrite reductase/ring-hydroxylating ferredoxin subunit
MPWIAVAAVAECPPGECRRVEAAGWPMAVVNVGGTFHAIDDTCPHMGGPLGDGYLDGTTLLCPWHAWRFDVTTGAALVNPSVRVRTYPVRVAGDRIEVEVPA